MIVNAILDQLVPVFDEKNNNIHRGASLDSSCAVGSATDDGDERV
jgi:hypothetical protein